MFVSKIGIQNRGSYKNILNWPTIFKNGRWYTKFSNTSSFNIKKLFKFFVTFTLEKFQWLVMSVDYIALLVKSREHWPCLWYISVTQIYVYGKTEADFIKYFNVSKSSVVENVWFIWLKIVMTAILYGLNKSAVSTLW